MDSSFRLHPCEVSDDICSKPSRANACRNDLSGPILDPALSGVQKTAAQNLAFGFLDLQVRMALSLGVGRLKRMGAGERLRPPLCSRTPQAFSFTVRSFFTAFTPGTCQADHEAWALVVRSGTSPLNETTPAFV